MKKLVYVVAALFMFISAGAQVKFTALSFSPVYPKANDLVSFDYNASFSPLKSEKQVQIVIYKFNGFDWVVAEPKLTKLGNTYKGNVKLEDNTTAIAFLIKGDKEKDLNANKGYTIPVYGADNTPVKGYYITAANLAGTLGENLFGYSSNPENAVAMLIEGKEKYPEMANDYKYMDSYWSKLNQWKKKEAAEEIAMQLDKYASAENYTEEEYQMISNWYSRLKQKEKAEAVMAKMKGAYPDGKWRKGETIQSFYKEKDPAKKAAIYSEFAATYPISADNKNEYEFYMSQVANAYAAANNYESYNEWNQKLGLASQAANNNSTSWKMAEANNDLQSAKKMSYIATSYAKTQIDKPAEPKPKTATTAEWLSQRKNTYAMYADTYAYIEYLLGDYKGGYPYAMEAAKINDFKDAELNERYALLLAKTETPAIAIPRIEEFVKNGKATAKTKDALKELYIKKNSGDKGYEAYITNLENAAKEKRKADIAKTIMNKPAPNFSLKDFDGKTVSLAEMKGKTVIVDFWATWCGPCIASMPGMNMSREKYAANSNVKFLFVDTWETEADKLKNAKDFMEKKKFPFYVLMDTEDKMVSDYAVNGIPTKFIIDKNGNIRFKAVGYEGDAQALVDELDVMIELAGK